MMINKNGLIYNDNNYMYFNDNEFKFEKIHYERDVYNGRCYMLEDGKCVAGALAKRRISKKVFDKTLAELKKLIPVSKN